jgi:release factor glutamine methyltransferase
VELRAGDLCAPVLGRQFQLITANPPYVSEQEYAELSPLVRDHEPRLALLSGPAGLDLLQRLAIEAPACLQAEGHLLAEIGAGQGPAVATLFARHGWREVVIKRDLSSRDRFLVARRPQVAP